MISRTASRLWKAIRYDPRNLIVPFRHPCYFASGIHLFNGNRIIRHPSARIDKAHGRVQFGCFWDLWRSRGGIVLHEKACLRFGGDVVIGDGVIIEVHPGALLEIGAETFINPCSKILALEQIRIGSRCAISWDVQIVDGDYHVLLESEKEQDRNTAPIRIGDHVWIGARSQILKGADIGEGAIVGAGSVVTGSVAPRTAVAGNPARRIRENVSWRK